MTLGVFSVVFIEKIEGNGDFLHGLEPLSRRKPDSLQQTRKTPIATESNFAAAAAADTAADATTVDTAAAADSNTGFRVIVEPRSRLR